MTLVVSERIMIFVDGSNIFRSLRSDYPNINIDYVKLRDHLVGTRNLIQTYFFGARPVPTRPLQEDFYHYLEEQGFTLEIMDLKYYGSKVKEKGLDTALVIEMLVHAFHGNYDVGVLVGGDEDYLKLVNEVKRLGPKVEVASFRSSMSNRLRRSGIAFIPLDDILDEIKKTSV